MLLAYLPLKNWSIRKLITGEHKSHSSFDSEYNRVTNAGTRTNVIPKRKVLSQAEGKNFVPLLFKHIVES